MTDYLLLFSVVVAGGLTALFIKKYQKWLPYLISFSGGYLFAIIIFHLLPEIFGHPVHHEHLHEYSPKTVGVFILLGLLFQMFLEYFSRGVEHAHTHSHGSGLTLGVILGLFLHAFTEGLPVHQLHDHAYLYGILVHKFPIALVLTSFLIHTGLKMRQILILLILFALMTPLGTLVGEKIEFLVENHVYVSAFVAGLLTHISTAIIFETDTSHRIPLKKLLVIILAFILAYLN